MFREKRSEGFAENQCRSSCLLFLLIQQCAAVTAALSCPADAPVAALVFAYNRPTSVSKTLRSFTNALGEANEISSKLALYVSIDSSLRAERVLRSVQTAGVPSQCVWFHAADVNQTPRERISSHYYFGFNKLFSAPELNHSYVIVLEDDLLFAPDFVSYMTSFLSQLGPDPRDPQAPACISGWNDNGASPALCNSGRVRRTTFFPGLGWAFSRTFWLSVLQDIWPGASSGNIVGTGWDFWMRSQFDSHGWHCVIPEVPRVFHFGIGGTNVGVFDSAMIYDLAVLASTTPGQLNWSTLTKNLANEDVTCTSQALANATVIQNLDDGNVRDLAWDCTSDSSFGLCDPGQTHYVLLYNREDFSATVAKSSSLHLWPVPRSHYDHVLTFYLSQSRVLHIADRRRSSQLPFHLRLGLPSSTTVTAARQNVSCTEHCKILSIESEKQCSCSAFLLEHLNTCAELKKHFPCSTCVYETGADLPAFVVPDAQAMLSTAGSCLLTETGLSSGSCLDCDGRFEWTQRLCACACDAKSSPAGSIDGGYEAFEEL